MEVVPTSDGDDDDGVIWFRWPQCQGFLPKLSGGDPDTAEKDEVATNESGQANDETGEAAAVKSSQPDSSVPDDALPWDSPADMMAAQTKADQVNTDGAETALEQEKSEPFLPEDDGSLAGGDQKSDYTSEAAAKKEEPATPAEPIAEYAAMLAEVDAAKPTPYRPWGDYEVGQCIEHLAWEDCGVVVAKENLPGGRKIIKCYFEDAGVVRLIEQAPR